MKTHITRLAKYLSVVLFTLLMASCVSEEENISGAVQSHLERSTAYQEQGQYRAAIIEARNIIKKDNKNNLGYLRLAEIYAILGNPKAASNLIESIPAPNAESQIQLAEAFLKQRKYVSAQKALDEYIFQGGETNTDKYTLLEIQISSNKNQAAGTATKLQAFTQQSPDNIEAQNLLTRLYVGNKQTAEANRLMSETLAKAPKDPATLHLASQLAYLKNDLPAAETHLTNALLELRETDIMLPIRTQVLKQLSRILTEQGHTTEALAYTKLLAESNPEGSIAQSQFRQAIKALNQGNTEEGEEILQKIYKEHPSNTMVALYLGLIDYQQGDFSSASDLLSGNIDVELSSPKIIQTTALSLLRQNKIAESQQLLEKATLTHPDEPKLLALYGLTLLQNELTQQDGILAIQRSLAIDPKMYSLRIALARYYASKKNNEQAHAQLELALKEDPGNVLASSLYAQLLEAIGNKNEAQKIINNMIANRPNDIAAINLAARYALANENNELAQKLFAQSLKTEAENPEALARLALMSIQKSDYLQASTYYTALTNAAPYDPAGYKGLVTAMEANGQNKEAIERLIEMAELKNNSQGTAAAVAAEYYLRKGDAEKAIPLIEKAILIEQTPYIKLIAFETALVKAQEAVLAQDWARARETLVESAAYSNNTVKIQTLLADIETRSGNFVEADRLIQKLLVDFPGNLMPILANAKLLDSQNKVQDATDFLLGQWKTKPEKNLGNAIYGRLIDNKEQVSEFLTTWKAQDSKSPQPYIFSALSAQKENNAASAINDYEKALALKPDNATVLNNLAWLYHEASDKRAEATAKQAYQLAPKSPAIMDTYGWILVQNGKISEGKALLTEALELAPPETKPEIEDHLKKAQ